MSIQLKIIRKTMSEITNPVINIDNLYNSLKILPYDIISIIKEYNSYPWRIVPKWDEHKYD